MGLVSSFLKHGLLSVWAVVFLTNGLWAHGGDQPSTAIQRQSELNINDFELRGGVYVPSSLVSPHERIQDFQDVLESRLIDQPEIIKTLVELEWDKMIFGEGQRTHPEIIYLMGQPGTGKDTAAEAYVDAMNSYQGAHLKHMFRMPVAQKEADLWKVFGSNTGYVGSTDLSPFIRWLVKHSGGRYRIVKSEGAHSAPYVQEVPDWDRQATVPVGYTSPTKAVVFVNEFHNWAKDAKDLLLKQALERGSFPINNPGKGLTEIIVPVTFVIATNEGIDLIAGRDQSGQRVGEDLPYERLIEKWEAVRRDKARLKKAIVSHGKQSFNRGESQGGVSEELLNRIPDQNILLMRPLSPEGLQKIAQMRLKELQAKYKKGEGRTGPLNIRWTADLVTFIQEYQFAAEDAARPVANKVISLIKTTINEAIKSGQIPTTPRALSYLIDIRKESDGTAYLTFKLERPRSLRSDGVTSKFEVFIDKTQENRPAEPLSVDEIESYTELANRMKAEVFGIDIILEQLERAVLLADEANREAKTNRRPSNPARSFMFLGLSSTGKTEAAKALARNHFESTSSMKVIDFGQIQNEMTLKQKILGTKDALGNPIKSEFMLEYDKHNGKVLFVFDEVANSPKEVLKALYDLLDEPVVTTFSDGEPRSMQNVVIIMTGNAGEEWFEDIPRDIPVQEQQTAMREIYDEAMKDPHFQRQFLERFFSEAFINRISEKNIFFFPPLSFKALRELTQLKLGQAFARLRSAEDGRWGWDLQMSSESDLTKLIESVEEEGFVLREQGRSIDRYVKQQVEESIRYALLKNHIQSGSVVHLHYKNKTEAHIVFEARVLHTDEVIDIFLPRQKAEEHSRIREEDRIITAYHEIGHELVRQVLFGGKYQSKLVSVIPGVTKLNGSFVRYLGIARYEERERVQPTREAIIQKLAVLLAGEVAQELVTGQYDGGNSNDIERATELARTAILKFGLSELWGRESPPQGMSLAEYVGSLSDQRRVLFEAEIKSFLSEGRRLAAQSLLANFDSHFIPMSLELARQGSMNREEIGRFYEERATLNPIQHPIRAALKGLSFNRMRLKLLNPFHRPTRDSEFLRGIPRPESVANIDSIIASDKELAVSQVPLPENFPVALGSSGAACRTGLQQSVQGAR